MNLIKKHLPFIMLCSMLARFIQAPPFDAPRAARTSDLSLYETGQEMETVQEKEARKRKEQREKTYQESLARVDQYDQQKAQETQKYVGAQKARNDQQHAGVNLKTGWNKATKSISDKLNSWSKTFTVWRAKRAAKSIYEKKAKNPNYTQEDQDLVKHLDLLDAKQKQEAFNAWMIARLKIYDKQMVQADKSKYAKDSINHQNYRSNIINFAKSYFKKEFEAVEKQMKASLKPGEILITSSSKSLRLRFEIIDMNKINPTHDLTTQWKKLQQSKEIEITEQAFTDIAAKYYLKQAQIKINAASNAFEIVNTTPMFFNFNSSFKYAIKNELNQQIKNLEKKVIVDKKLPEAQAQQLKAESEKLMTLEAKERAAATTAQQAELHNMIEDLKKTIFKQNIQEKAAKKLQDTTKSLVDLQTQEAEALSAQEQKALLNMISEFKKKQTELRAQQQARKNLETELQYEQAIITAEESSSREALAKKMNIDVTEIQNKIAQQKIQEKENEKRLQVAAQETAEMQSLVDQARQELQAARLQTDKKALVTLEAQERATTSTAQQAELHNMIEDLKKTILEQTAQEKTAAQLLADSKNLMILEAQEREATTAAQKTEFQNMIEALKTKKSGLEKEAAVQDAGEMFKNADFDAAQKEAFAQELKKQLAQRKKALADQQKEKEAAAQAKQTRLQALKQKAARLQAEQEAEEQEYLKQQKITNFNIEFLDMSPINISKITDFKDITRATIAALKPLQIKALTIDQIKTLSADQLSYLIDDQGNNLTSEQMNAAKKHQKILEQLSQM